MFRNYPAYLYFVIYFINYIENINLHGLSYGINSMKTAEKYRYRKHDSLPQNFVLAVNR